MTEYYIPKSGTITVAGKSTRMVRGLHEVSDAIADSKEAIAFGIKTVDEVTDAEWISIGKKKPAVKTKTLDGAVRKVATTS